MFLIKKKLENKIKKIKLEKKEEDNKLRQKFSVFLLSKIFLFNHSVNNKHGG